MCHKENLERQPIFSWTQFLFLFLFLVIFGCYKFFCIKQSFNKFFSYLSKKKKKRQIAILKHLPSYFPIITSILFQQKGFFQVIYWYNSCEVTPLKNFQLQWYFPKSTIRITILSMLTMHDKFYFNPILLLSGL